MDAEIESLEGRSHNLLQEIKKVGPDLKEVRMKIAQGMDSVLAGPHHRVPPHNEDAAVPLRRRRHSGNFRVHLAERAITGPALDHQQPGNAGHGKELLESRGCLACHSIGEGANMVGGHSRRISAASAKKTITIISSAGFTIRASARAPIAPSRSATSARKITPNTIFHSSSTSIIRAARTTATNWSCSSPPSCPVFAYRLTTRATSPAT